jgi:hypothetical protein
LLRFEGIWKFGNLWFPLLAGNLHEVHGVQAHTKVGKFLHEEKKYGERIKVCVNGTSLPVISYRLLVADTGIGSAGTQFQVSSFRFQVSGFRFQGFMF